MGQKQLEIEYFNLEPINEIFLTGNQLFTVFLWVDKNIDNKENSEYYARLIRKFKMHKAESW